jgi:hypothetical protein
MNRLVAAIWSGTLIAAVVGVVPTVIGLLQRALKAAQSIDRYTAEILTAGVGVAGNTASVAALKETRTVAPGLLAGAESIERHAAAIEQALADAGGATEEQP